MPRLHQQNWIPRRQAARGISTQGAWQTGRAAGKESACCPISSSSSKATHGVRMRAYSRQITPESWSEKKKAHYHNDNFNCLTTKPNFNVCCSNFILYINYFSIFILWQKLKSGLQPRSGCSSSVPVYSHVL
jgi:hypothetical protein